MKLLTRPLVASGPAGDAPAWLRSRVRQFADRDASSGPRALLAITAAAGLFIGLFLFRLSVGGPVEGISLLYTVPIALLALQLGTRAGLAAALISFLLFGAYAELKDVDASPLAYSTRAVTFLLLATLFGRYGERVRNAERSLADHAGRLTELMHRADPLEPGERVEGSARDHDAQLLELTSAFNQMLTRLETERRESARRALAVHEEERSRLARELHDEVGQVLTGIIIHLERAARRLPEDAREELLETQRTARSSLDDVRRIMRELRPAALDDLGLRSALLSLSEQLGRQAAVQVETVIDENLPGLDPAAELVVYRVAQESLTNAVRHSGASRVEVGLDCLDSGGVRLRVQDDGRGLAGGADGGGGIRGMRERALAVGARLSIDTAPGGGVTVILDVPGEQEES